MSYRLRPIAATGIDYDYDLVNPVKHGGDCTANPLRLVLGDDEAGNWQDFRAAACGHRSIAGYRTSMCNLSTEQTHSRNPHKKRHRLTLPRQRKLRQLISTRNLLPKSTTYNIYTERCKEATFRRTSPLSGSPMHAAEQAFTLAIRMPPLNLVLSFGTDVHAN
jgi:hypothetical protein